MSAVADAKRLVVKVGTSTLTYENGRLNLRRCLLYTSPFRAVGEGDGDVQFAVRVPCPDRPVHLFHQRPGNGQPQPRGISRRLHREEAIEQPPHLEIVQPLSLIHISPPAWAWAAITACMWAIIRSTISRAPAGLACVRFISTPSTAPSIPKMSPKSTPYPN